MKLTSMINRFIGDLTPPSKGERVQPPVAPVKPVPYQPTQPNGAPTVAFYDGRPTERKPRPLTDSDADAFEVASGEYERDIIRKRKYDNPRPPGDWLGFLPLVKRTDPERMTRLMADLEWLDQQAQLYGMNGKDVLWLLY